MSGKTNIEKAKRLIHAAKAAQNAKAQNAVIQKMVKDALDQHTIGLRKSTYMRKSGFNTSMAHTPDGTTGGLHKALLSKAEKGSALHEFQKACDNVYLTSIICDCHPTELECYKNLQSMKFAKDNYNTTDFNTTNWWPNTLSRDMIEGVEKELKVADAFRTIQMPTNPFKIPSRTGRTKTYLVGESTTDAGTTPPTTKGPAPADGIVFDAKKLMSYVIISEETTEDMVLPILDIIKEDVAKSMAESIEEACINGQIAAHDIDTQLALAANDSRRAWDGLRVHAMGGGWTHDFATWTNATGVSLMRKLRAVMGHYGINPANLSILCSITGYNHLLNISELLTIDKYGPNATLMKGEMGRFDNIPVIISEFIPEYLNATGAYTSTVDATYTCIMLVYTGGFAHGERAQFTVKQGEEVKTDQRYLVTRARRDFQPLYQGATYADSIVACGFGLPNQI